MTLPKKLLLEGTAVGVTVLGLLFATYAGGPAVRTVLGVPKEFSRTLFLSSSLPRSPCRPSDRCGCCVLRSWNGVEEIFQRGALFRCSLDSKSRNGGDRICDIQVHLSRTISGRILSRIRQPRSAPDALLGCSGCLCRMFVPRSQVPKSGSALTLSGEVSPVIPHNGCKYEPNLSGRVNQPRRVACHRRCIDLRRTSRQDKHQRLPARPLHLPIVATCLCICPLHAVARL
jgi:hypothetical protein